MKRILITLFLIMLLITGLPFLIVEYCRNPATENELPKAAHELSPTVSVYIKTQDEVVSMDTTQYLKEVVAAEMPAAFHPEALRAQAVAARTYLINRMRVHKDGTEVPEHKGADICTDATHCKAWLSEADRRAAWGDDANENWAKISSAVESTAGVIITYNSEPISAVFHSTSSGHTENAKDVWGGDVPYLVSVTSPGEDQSPRYQSELDLSIEEFQEIGNREIQNVDWTQGIIGETVRSDAGGIISIVVGGVQLKGTTFRAIYGLRSTNVEIEVVDGRVKMRVTGFGHGVGMSQYGANHLATQGKNYVEILETYYTGVCVESNAS